MQTLDTVIITSVHWAGTITMALAVLAFFTFVSVSLAWYMIDKAWTSEMAAHVIWHCWRRTRFTRAPKFVRPIKPSDQNGYKQDLADELERGLDLLGVPGGPDDDGESSPENA